MILWQEDLDSDVIEGNDHGFELPFASLSGTEKLDFDVTFKFSDQKRNPVVYSGVTYGSDKPFSKIYQNLTDNYTNGVSFIDIYFDTVFPYRAVARDIDEHLIKVELLLEKELDEQYIDDVLYNIHLSEMESGVSMVKKDGSFDKRFKLVKTLEKLYLERSFILNEGDYLASLVKEDIKECLSNGIIPLPPVSIKTAIRKKELGLNPNPLIATGQLVDALVIIFKLREEREIAA